MTRRSSTRAPYGVWALAVGCLVAPAAGTAAQSPDQDALSRWESFEWRQRAVDSAALDTLPLHTLQRLRAILFGRHGRVFSRDSALQAYLTSRPWYRPDSAFSNASLSAVERETLDRIRMAEARKHRYVEPGDMRYWRRRPLTLRDLRRYTAEEWEILLEEVEANHGKPIPLYEAWDFEQTDTTYLWRFFNERYWYARDPSYTPERLTATERANLDTLRVARMLQEPGHLRPGLMHLFRANRLSEAMLEHSTLYELRLLRNEIYARRGRPFRTPWIAEHFADEPWYVPRPDYSDAELTPTEHANIATIVAVERRRHEALATAELDASDLQGLFPEDARLLRYEIYARRGLVFKDRRVQAYFASLPWYRPDPRFEDSLLTDVERRNVVAILEHEQRAAQGERFIPPG